MTADKAGRRATWSATLALYLRRDVMIIAALGFSAGLPLALSGATLSVWMADSGIDLGTIGLLSLAGLPYTLKFAWAPLVDALHVPLLSQRLGRRRGWLIACQLTLMVAILFLGTRDPLTAPFAIGFGALMVAAASATQDIVIDAYRIERLTAQEQAPGTAAYVATYRLGMLVSGAGVITLTTWLEQNGVGKQAAWSVGYALAAALVVVGIFAVLLAREPASVPERRASSASTRIVHAGAAAFKGFLGRDAAVILVFVMLFRMCDSLAGTMTGPFVLALGYDKATYAAIVNGAGLGASVLGGLAGGYVATMLTQAKALWIAAALQAASNLAFVWLAIVEPHAAALAVTVVIENLAAGIASVIFIAYLSSLCAHPGHTATQYALLSALASFGRTLVSAGSGYAAAWLGWPAFFLATALAAIPGMVVLAVLQTRGHFDAIAPPANQKA